MTKPFQVTYLVRTARWMFGKKEYSSLADLMRANNMDVNTDIETTFVSKPTFGDNGNVNDAYLRGPKAGMAVRDYLKKFFGRGHYAPRVKPGETVEEVEITKSESKNVVARAESKGKVKRGRPKKAATLELVKAPAIVVPKDVEEVSVKPEVKHGRKLSVRGK